jgi:AcrR family transcriptional regulator
MAVDGAEVAVVTDVASPADPEVTTCRPMRADARRNYELLIATAREELAAHGSDASMESIAKRAGVGVGTLYRHFPRRIDLVEAVYRTDVDQLVQSAQDVGALEPWDALVSWMEAFLDYAKTKRTFLSELHEAFEKNPNLKVESRSRIEGAMGVVLSRAQAAGEVRHDVDEADLMQLLGTMCMSATLTDDQGHRLLAMILDGLRQPNAISHA